MRSLARDIELATRRFNAEDREPFVPLEAILNQYSAMAGTAHSIPDSTAVAAFSSA
jgi:hypothetical protein